MYDIPKLFPYGFIRKTHGHKGEVIIELEDENLFDLDPDFLFVEIEGIRIPFAVDSLRGVPERLICKFEQVSTEEEGDRLRGARLFIPAESLSEAEDSDDGEDMDIIGLKVVHPKGGLLGEIVDIDDSTENELLLVRSDSDGREVLLPFVSEWVQYVDEKKGELFYDYPEELTEM